MKRERKQYLRKVKAFEDTHTRQEKANIVWQEEKNELLKEAFL